MGLITFAPMKNITEEAAPPGMKSINLTLNKKKTKAWASVVPNRKVACSIHIINL